MDDRNKRCQVERKSRRQTYKIISRHSLKRGNIEELENQIIEEVWKKFKSSVKTAAKL